MIMINFFYIFKHLECGGFCVKYIFKKDRIKPNIEYNPKLMSLGLIKRVLQEYYVVKCYVVNNIKLLNNGNCLTLIRVRKKFLHYIVIKYIKNDVIYFYDPAFLVIRKMNIEKFKKIWVNYCCFYIKK